MQQYFWIIEVTSVFRLIRPCSKRQRTAGIKDMHVDLFNKTFIHYISSVIIMYYIIGESSYSWMEPVNKNLCTVNIRLMCLCPLFPSHFFTLDSFVSSRIFFLFFNPLRKQDPKALSEKSYFPYATLSGAKREKASLFSMSQASMFFLGRTNCNEVSKVSCLECLFQSRCPGPSLPGPSLPAPACGCSGLGSPGGRRRAHAGWKNRPGH